jgi:hypothetical protein
MNVIALRLVRFSPGTWTQELSGVNAVQSATREPVTHPLINTLHPWTMFKKLVL